MKLKRSIPGILFICLMALSIGQANLFAQDQTPRAAKPQLFSNQKRPIPEFDHTLHEDSLEDGGCAQCHHVLDTDQNRLVYAEGEEAACSECHSSEPEEERLALREANHASCTGCHRTLKKMKKPAGPTTCGECHKN